jgi:hypothetical protein
MTKAPNPATTPVIIIDPDKVPDAADVFEVELAAEAVVVPLTSWFTTETATFDEFAQESPDSTVAFELNEISAHYFPSAPSARCPLLHFIDLPSTYIVQCTASLTKRDDLQTRILAISWRHAGWQDHARETKSPITSLVQRRLC